MERFEGAYQMTYRRSTISTISTMSTVSTMSTLTSTPTIANVNAKKLKKKLLVVDKQMKKPTKKDLVYLDDSPDYCERNQT